MFPKPIGVPVRLKHRERGNRNPQEPNIQGTNQRSTRKMFSRTSMPAVLSVILGVSAFAIAQRPQDPAPNREMRPEGMRHRDGRDHDKRGGPGHRGLMRELSLTEDQKQQQHAIVERQLQSTKAQREELFKLREKRTDGAFTADDEARAKALREEIHNSMQSIREEIAATLTPEQRTKLEQIKSERKAKREEMFRRREERLENNPQQ
jgi:periplasmic protein CpxP/Spy